MTKEDLFNAMDGIDEKSLVRASSDKKKIKTGSVVSGIVVAVLLCGAAFPFSKLIGVYLRGKIDFESKITEPVPTETGTSATTEPDETVGDVTTEPPFPDDVLFRGSYFYTVDKNLGFGTKYNVAHSFDELKTIFDLFECSEHIVDFSERDFINGTVLVIERLNDGIDDYGITAIGAKTFAPSYHSESITISSVQDKESGPLKKHTTSVIAVKLGAVEVINQVILTENDEPFFSLYRSEMNEISTAMLNVKLYDISTNTIIRDQDALYGTSTQERDYAFRVNSVKGKVFVFFNGKLYEVSEDVFTDGMPEYLLENCCLIFENCATVYVSDIDGDGYDDICGWQRLGFLNATGISVYSPHAGEKVFSLFDYGHYNYSLAGFSSDGSIKVRESVFGRANGRTGELTSAESGITVRWDREQATEPPVYDVKSEYSDFNLPEEMSAKKAWDVLNAKESLVGNNEYVMFDN
ncbi:MAG: hypothetical protein J5563_08855, partial [Clostridia bacterium]|nr:hypothetical protein [Clostridia bacterium]